MAEQLFTDQEILEGYDLPQVAKFIVDQALKIIESERLIELASGVLDAYGTTIDRQLELLYENTETTST
jgi:hypothetical protein